MGYNRNMLRLQPFSTNDAATTVTWPQSSTEARWWAGPQTSWPIAPDVFQRWHADPDVHVGLRQSRSRRRQATVHRVQS